MEIKRIGFIGNLAYKEEKFDGQTVSTRLWVSELEKLKAQKNLISVDTYNFKKRIFAFVWDLLKCLSTSSHIVFMLSTNGMKAILPFLYYANKIFRRKIYHRVIGGSISQSVAGNPKWVKYMNSFNVNWVQSERIVADLRGQGVRNGKYLKNFRNMDSVSLDDIKNCEYPPYKYCTFCRVTKKKGITTAIESIAKVNSESKSIVAVLHIFGPIDDAYKEEFDNLLEVHKEYVKYLGVISQDCAVSTLKDYYYHLFPTTWDSEGFPGTLIDCYNAGLPTIATNWAYNSELIANGITGMIYNWSEPQQLSVCIKKSMEETEEEHWQKRLNNLNEAKKYRASVVMLQVNDDLMSL